MSTSSLFYLLLMLLFLAGCSGNSGDEIVDTTPADTWFSLAVTENSHNHTGAQLLFLDFQDSSTGTSVSQNNIINAPKVESGKLTLDGDISDWNSKQLTVVNGLVQNNYPLSEFIDALPTNITVGAAWDDDYIYFVLQWKDAGHSASTKYKKWFYGDQGGGENGWNAMLNAGATIGAPNQDVANSTHELSGAESEDRVFMMFPIVDQEGNFAAGKTGCAAYCHLNLSDDNPFQNYTGNGKVAMHTNLQGDSADIWHWKAARTEPAGFADDKLLVYGTGSENGRKSDEGSSAYEKNALQNSGNPSFMPSSEQENDDVLLKPEAVPYSGEPAQGDTLPATLSKTPDGSRADVESAAHYDESSYRWTIEFRRLRNTGNDDDRQFVIGSSTATPPAGPTVTVGDAGTGATLYETRCQRCHGENGMGEISGDSWHNPRVQRASGSLILKSMQSVDAMKNLSPLTEQEAEHIAAFLQIQTTFDATYPLSITLNGVTNSTDSIITSAPAGISCPDNCSYKFLPDTEITLSYKYLGGYQFSGWSGINCKEGSQTGIACTFTLSTAQSVSADYAATTITYSLSVTTGNYGSVSSFPIGISCSADSTCSADFSENAAVTLTATPEAGYKFSGWSGDCSGSGSCMLTMAGDQTVSATFEQLQGAAFCTVSGTPPQIPDIATQTIATGLSFPVDVTNAGDSSGRLFLVEQQGVIKVYQNGSVQPGLFLDIRDRVAYVPGSEQGMYSVAFHPKFTANGKFYVNYVSEFDVTSPKCSTNNLCTIVSEFTLGTTTKLEDSERIILEIGQPDSNHNGGHLLFGPEPSPYLYIGMGDGGGANDPDNNGQDLTTLLAAMLRIDIDNKDPGLEYAIPADNPTWSGITGARREIWAWGLRNPWRFTFDPANGDLYVGDVGQDDREEIDIINKGGNYGWRVVEGDICNPNVGDPCAPDDYRDRFESPIISPKASDGWKSITGGVVYRGSTVTNLCGVYLYADFAADEIMGVRYDSTNNNITASKKLLSSPSISNIVSFGYDETYEVYMLDYINGTLYQIVAP